MKKGKKKNKPPARRKKYRRTIKRYSLRMNAAKWSLLEALARAYAGEKDIFLLMNSGLSRMSECKNFRALRNALVAGSYKSKFNLQGRLWKLALKDALETLDRYWSAQRAEWKERIYGASLNEKERHYLYKALKSYRNLEQVIFHGPNVSLEIELDKKEREKCRRHLQQWIKESVKKYPRVKICRSFLAEPETYRIFTHQGRQYISVMTFIKGFRLCIPLTGRGEIRGQIRILLDFEKRRVEVHHTVMSKVKKSVGQKKGIDLGITEVFTDSDGDRWGTDFGQVLSRYSEKQKNKGKRRNKLHSLKKKHREKSNNRKKRKIEKNNLGKKKQEKKHCNQKLHLTEIVNSALNAFFKAKDFVIYAPNGISRTISGNFAPIQTAFV
jgi:hypothetical protein